MKSESLDILEKAKLISEGYSRILSKDLKPVCDAHSAMLLPSWRNSPLNEEVPLHRIMSRVGGFPASLARYFIAAYSRPSEIVLDPFCGKGTALLEAVIMGRMAIGGDIAPDAVIVSRAKCSPLSIAKAINYIQNLSFDSDVTFSSVPKDVALFFSKKTLKQILSMREQLLEDLSSGSAEKKKMATFVCGLVLGVLHGRSRLSLSLPCNQCFAMSPGYVRRYSKEHNLKTPDRDVKECLIQKALEILPAPKNMEPSWIFERPAEGCDTYMKEKGVKAHLVLTSPPYLDRQTYLKDSWLRSWFLKRDWETIKKHSLETGSVKIFFEGMLESLSAIWRSLEENGTLVLVCGKAKVEIGRKKRLVKVSDISLLAVERIRPLGYRFEVESIVTDRILMKRGSYFAVTHGKLNKRSGTGMKRYGEDEIIVLRKI